MSNRQAIVDSFIRIMFVDAYASFVERLHEDREPTDDLSEPGGGENWMDFAPETTEECKAYAIKAIAEIEKHAGTTIEALYWRACMACNREGARCHAKSHTPDHFGSDVMMQYVGHGVAWDDDHALDMGDLIPYGESWHGWCRSDFGLGEVGSEGGGADSKDTDEDSACDLCGDPVKAHGGTCP